VNKQNVRDQKLRGARRSESGFSRLLLTGTFFSVLGGLALLVASSAGAGASRGAQDKGGAGVTFSKQATSREVGLPLFPGAKPHKDEKEDSPSVQMGIWGSTFGFKLAVMKLESNDAPEKIAEFYKKALAKYGTVLNCSDPSQRPSAKDSMGSSDKLECGDDKPEKGGFLFKAGTKEKQHLVGIQSSGQGSLFQLVYLEARGHDKDKKSL
jgi:hypothetical protein